MTKVIQKNDVNKMIIVISVCIWTLSSSCFILGKELLKCEKRQLFKEIVHERYA